MWAFSNIGSDFHMEKSVCLEIYKVSFEIYDVPTWLTNLHIAQYLTKERQPGIEIWLVNRM